MVEPRVRKVGSKSSCLDLISVSGSYKSHDLRKLSCLYNPTLPLLKVVIIIVPPYKVLEQTKWISIYKIAKTVPGPLDMFD